MLSKPVDFDRSVFLNCPFDEEYRSFLRAQIFTVLACGLRPRVASEHVDSGRTRFEKIRDLVGSCRFSIHDLSRVVPLGEKGLPRFNMPFELGLDFGCRYYGESLLATKQCLILESEPFRYREVLSDISGHDIRAHRNETKTLITEVRNWLRAATGRGLPSGSHLWQKFHEFTSHLQLSLKGAGFTTEEIDDLETLELIEHTETWIQKISPLL